ncbi:MAG: DUF86 domain-containing protein [Actinobacteria bacterium]|nr:DUF86 domain-containing protein [Actinomycetota bacterium]
MKHKREYIDYLLDIRDAIEKVENFTNGMNYDLFVNDNKTVFAVIRALEIIGEASKKIPDSVKNNNPLIPWREISGIRDKLIHEYFGVNIKVVWKTIEEDIPVLKPLIEEMIKGKD